MNKDGGVLDAFDVLWSLLIVWRKGSGDFVLQLLRILSQGMRNLAAHFAGPNSQD